MVEYYVGDATSNPRAISWFAVGGSLVLLASGGFTYESGAGGVAVQLSQGAIVAWPLMLVGSIGAVLAPPSNGRRMAPWWRRACAFFVDFSCALSLAGIPFCLLALVAESGSAPPPWEFARAEVRPHDAILTAVSVPTFACVWTALGLAFHPSVTTPGALALGIVLHGGARRPWWRLAVFGVFAYYGVVIPIFKFFAVGLQPEARMRAT